MERWSHEQLADARARSIDYRAKCAAAGSNETNVAPPDHPKSPKAAEKPAGEACRGRAIASEVTSSAGGASVDGRSAKSYEIDGEEGRGGAEKTVECCVFSRWCLCERTSLSTRGSPSEAEASACFSRHQYCLRSNV